MNTWFTPAPANLEIDNTSFAKVGSVILNGNEQSYDCDVLESQYDDATIFISYGWNQETGKFALLLPVVRTFFEVNNSTQQQLDAWIKVWEQYQKQ